MRHPVTGGLSWLRSTPVAWHDRVAGRAATASGRLYCLGTRIRRGALDEEGAVALRLLAGGPHLGGAADRSDAAWLTARKISRHLGLEAPPRGDTGRLLAFVGLHSPAYAAWRALPPGPVQSPH